jgi:hypothetical protein
MSDLENEPSKKPHRNFLERIFFSDTATATSEEFQKRKFTYFSGIVLVYGAGILFFFGVVGSVGQSEHQRLASPDLTFVGFISFYFREILISVASAMALMLGNRLLRQIGVSDQPTIPERDREIISDAIKEGKEDAVRLYIQLRSLTGFTGAFTKLGLTGLPLTTVALTIFFSLLSFSPGELGGNFLDLAKLTLGAFIGSFVQRQVEGRRQETDLERVVQRMNRDGARQTQQPPGGTGGQDGTQQKPAGASGE